MPDTVEDAIREEAGTADPKSEETDEAAKEEGQEESVEQKIRETANSRSGNQPGKKPQVRSLKDLDEETQELVKGIVKSATMDAVREYHDTLESQGRLSDSDDDTHTNTRNQKPQAEANGDAALKARVDAIELERAVLSAYREIRGDDPGKLTNEQAKKVFDAVKGGKVGWADINTLRDPTAWVGVAQAIGAGVGPPAPKRNMSLQSLEGPVRVGTDGEAREDGALTDKAIKELKQRDPMAYARANAERRLIEKHGSM